jgi:hypothetical protein
MQDREGRRIRLEVSGTRHLRSTNRVVALLIARLDNKVESLVDARPMA